MEHTLPGHQGCSVLKNSEIIKDGIKVHRVAKEFKTNIFNIVFSQNIESKTPQLGEDIKSTALISLIFGKGIVLFIDRERCTTTYRGES